MTFLSPNQENKFQFLTFDQRFPITLNILVYSPYLPSFSLTVSISPSLSLFLSLSFILSSIFLYLFFSFSPFTSLFLSLYLSLSLFLSPSFSCCFIISFILSLSLFKFVLFLRHYNKQKIKIDRKIIKKIEQIAR